jgi:hypothetical protein
MFTALGGGRGGGGCLPPKALPLSPHPPISWHSAIKIIGNTTWSFPNGGGTVGVFST